MSVHAVDARAIDVARSRRLPLALVLLAAFAYVAVAGYFALRKHDAILSGYDLAIADQELWLLAHGHEPLSTLDGRLFWGEHFSLSLALLTPLWVLGAGATTLLVLQAVTMGAVSPLLYLLARSYGASEWLAALPALVWVASPLTLVASAEDVHHIPLVAPVVVGSVVALKRDRLTLFAALALIACLAKEDVSLMYVMLGVAVAIEGRRRLGAAIGVVAFGIFLFAVAVFMPAFGDSASWYAKRFAGRRGDSVADALVWMLRHPGSAAADLVTGQNISIVLVLVLTCGGLCFLAPRWMLLGLPALAHNLLSAYPPQHQLGRQYFVPVALSFAIAAGVGVHRFRIIGRIPRLVLSAGIMAALVSVVFGVLSVHTASQWTPEDTSSSGGVAVRRAALAFIPDEVAVTASPRLAAHLSQRKEIYAFPLPFLGRREFGTDWTDAEMARRAKGVRWIALDTSDRPTEFQDGPERMLPILPRLGFREVYRDGSLVILTRADAG